MIFALIQICFLPASILQCASALPLSAFRDGSFKELEIQSVTNLTQTNLILCFQCKVTEMIPGDGLDNDCDGQIDEEVFDAKDNDGDGKIDEDLQLVRFSGFSKLKHEQFGCSWASL